MSEGLPPLKNCPYKLTIFNRIIYEQLDNMQFASFVDLETDMRILRHFVNYWFFKTVSVPGILRLQMIYSILIGLWAIHFLLLSYDLLNGLSSLRVRVFEQFKVTRLIGYNILSLVLVPLSYIYLY